MVLELRHTEEGNSRNEKRVRNLQAAVAERDLGRLGVNAAKGSSLAVGEVVQSGLGDVEAGSGVVDGKDVDGLAVVGQGVALLALCSSLC